MADRKVQLEMIGDVAVVRLNDPGTLNAVTLQMLEEFGQVLGDVAGRARAMLLTGAGRAFCAGANLRGDLTALAPDGLPDAGAVLERHINPLMQRLRALPLPWVSAVRGAAAGVGCSLALAADLIVASENAYFLQAFARIGLIPDGGSFWLLTRAIGRPRAMEMMLLGERIASLQALEWGLINRRVAEDKLDYAALELAQGLSKGPTRSLAMIREVAWAAVDLDWDQTLELERRTQLKAGRTQDNQEGVAAFLEKREAHFKGN
jgi:2-(1,2-epoxy-1,2-dihydrophenyl)acetyl-CoA isomerase